jgi:hypothetical protein
VVGLGRGGGVARQTMAALELDDGGAGGGRR